MTTNYDENRISVRGGKYPQRNPTAASDWYVKRHVINSAVRQCVFVGNGKTVNDDFKPQLAE